MASLSAHLREAGDHGALAFHPECPVCRDERLAGTLSADALVGRRTQALFAAGVLALSSATPTVALAQEPDQEQEGSAAPDQAAVTDPAGDPDFDPGGESTDLPFDAGPTPDGPVVAEPDDDETGALEQEPTTNEDAPVADAGDGTSTAPPSEQQAPPTAETTQPAAPTPEATPEPAEPPPAAGEPVTTPDPTEPEADAGRHARDDMRARSRRSNADARSENVPAPAPAPEPVAVASDPNEPTTIYVAQEPSPSPAVSAAADGRAARPGDRAHVVLAGESLWSIARDVLGDGASVARIAREVNRLWEVNGDRIGTGDPDLLMVGTRLTLR
jgi:hypothetical protein